jgi:uncharacterized protein
MANYEALKNEQFISLTTFRKTGAGVSTPVWFTLEGDTVYVLTLINAGKLKRLQNNPQVEITASDYAGKTHGVTYQGTAITHEADSAKGQYANKALTQKFGFQKRIFDLFHIITGSKRKYLEIQLS